MPGKLSSLRKRLAKVEQRMADRVLRSELANCTGNPPCPAHGLRRLGRIVRIAFINLDRTRVPNPRLDELIETTKLVSLVR